MKRSYSEYRATLISLVNRIREKQLKTGLGASIEELKDEFGGPSKSQRNLDNYLAALREKGIDGQTYNIAFDRTQRVYYIDSGLYKPSLFDEKRKKILAKELLKTYKDALPRSVLKLLDMDAKAESEEKAPLFRSVSPRFVKSLEFYQMLNRILQLAELNRIITFEYNVEPERDRPFDTQNSHLIHIRWSERVLERVMVMPLQIIEYFGRLYLLGYRVSLMNIQEENPPTPYPRNLDLFVLDNILDTNVRPIDEHHDFEPNQQEIIQFQKNLPRIKIFEELSLNQMLKSSIGVMLPSYEIYNHNKNGEISLQKPPKILRYFAGWAKRYLMTSPLHPSQQLLANKVVKSQNLSPLLQQFYQIKADSRGQEIGVEVGLFSFEVYSTPDFLFRIASFREFSWEYEKGLDGMSENKPKCLFKNKPQIIDESEYLTILKKISKKVLEKANYAFYKQCEEEWWDYYNEIYIPYSNPTIRHQLILSEAAYCIEIPKKLNLYPLHKENLDKLLVPSSHKTLMTSNELQRPPNIFLMKICKKVGLEMSQYDLKVFKNRDALIELAEKNVLIINTLPTHGILLEQSERMIIKEYLNEYVDYKLRHFNIDYNKVQLYNDNSEQRYPSFFWDNQVNN